MSEQAPYRGGASNPAVGRLRTVFGWAHLAIFWERLWRNLWPAAAVAAVFLSVALFDLLPLLPYWLHWVALVGFLSLFALRIWHVGKQSYLVGQSEIRKRLEEESGLSHRPLTALQETAINVGGGVRDEATAAIWQAYQARRVRELNAVKPLTPRPGLAARDLFGTRFAVWLILVIAIVSANGDYGNRFTRALLPTPAQANVTAIAFNVWITPPSYTGLAPVFLEGPAIHSEADPDATPDGPADAPLKPLLEAMSIPVGSSILVQISGAEAVPELQLGSRSVAVGRVSETTDDKNFRVEDTISEQDQAASFLKLVAGSELLGEWPVHILKDGPPVVAFTEPPKRTRQASLGLSFEARDDFAIKDVWAELSLPDADTSSGENEQIRFDLTARGFGTKLAKGRGERDYSAHRWAGLPVLIQLHARDSAGQVGVSELTETTLPAREFKHPVAKVLVEIRKNLNIASPGIIQQSTETLYGLMHRPEHYAHDTTVFLSISVARSRLLNNQSRETLGSVQDLLWETALRLEDGEFSIAERELKDIQERLAKAMRENAPSEELERLMDELQQTLNKYMQALAEHLERQGLSQMPMDPNARIMESMDLQKMVDRARDLAKTGAMDAARQVLSQLNRMLDGLRNGAQRSRQNQEMAKARKMMNELRDLAQRQQKLMDQTFRRSQSDSDRQHQQSQRPGEGQQRDPQTGQRGEQGQQGQRGQNGQDQGAPQSAEAMRQQQDALRRELGRLMLQMDDSLGEIPQGLGQAERSMKGAGQSLGEGDPSGAVPQQAEALEKLRQGMESAAEQMAQRMQGQGPGMGLGLMPGSQPNGQQQQGNNRDPFGRQNPDGQFGSVNDDSSIKVPTEREIFRAREIMDELHRRSGESDRQEPEREYIDRLLRRF